MNKSSNLKTVNELAHDSIADLLGTTLVSVPKEDKTERKQIEVLILILNTLEQGKARRGLLNNDFGLDLYDYDMVYEEALLSLADRLFGPETSTWINIYLHERIDEVTNEPKYLEDRDGKRYYLNTAEDLWYVIKSCEETGTQSDDN